MALRVLLADESSTIKKVIQLALQDYGVQVRSVTVGTEALEVARQFQPDLVLADVLLTKKNGYEVCIEIKNDAALKNVPVILMWSGFMEIDDKQFAISQANDRIEKPFNVETLRALVQKWVPKTKEQALSQFLHFPTTITQMEAEPSRLTVTGEATVSLGPMPSVSDGEMTAPVEAGPPGLDLAAMDPGEPEGMNDEKTVDWDMDSFEDINSFVSTDHLIQKSGVKLAPPAAEADVTMVTRTQAIDPTPEEPKNIQSNKPKTATAMPMGVKATPPPLPKNIDDDLVSVDLQALNNSPVDVSAILAQQSAAKKSNEAKASVKTELPPPPDIPQLSSEQLEQLIRAQSREIIESVVWKIVPEMAGQMIREELERLMAED